MLEMLHYEFVQRSLAVAFIIGPMCGLLGVFITLRGMAFLSDAVAHSAITGVAIGLLIEQVVQASFGASFPAWAQTLFLVTYCLGIAGLMAWLFEHSSLRPDTIIAFCFTGSVAFGVLVIAKLHRYRFLEGALFGDINANSWSDVGMLAVLAVATFAFVGLNLRALTLTTLQEEIARSDGLPARRLNYFLVLFVAATVALAIKLLGALLVSALIVIPAAASKLVAPHFRGMLLGALFLGTLGSVGGVCISCQFDMVTGATIVLFNVSLLVAAMLWRTFRPRNTAAMMKPVA